MTIKVARMDIFDDLLLPAQPCDLLIFWSRDNQRADYLKGTFPKK